MKKLNNKGFVMTETLVVAVFIMSIFAIMYNNYFPLIGEYERREVFDDIDGKYAAFWVKRFIQHDSFVVSSTMVNNINTTGYTRISCSNIDPSLNEYRQIMCNRLVDELEVDQSGGYPHIYLTKYSLVDFKNRVKNDQNYTEFSGGLHDYVEFLPEFSKVDSLNFAQYRVIIEFNRKKNDTNYYAYSTIEVKK